MAGKGGMTEHDRLAEQRAKAGDWRAVLEYCVGRGYAEGIPCPRGTLQPSVLKLARDFMAQRRQRRHDRKIAEAARRGDAGRFTRMAAQNKLLRELKRREQADKRLLSGRLGRSAVVQLLEKQTHFNSVGPRADALMRCVVYRVGGVDANDPLLRELRTSEYFGGRKGRHHRLERTTLDRVEYLRDWSAALLTIRDYTQVGSSNWGNGYGKRGGSSFRVYLAVGESLSKRATLVRVPPKYGNPETQFFNRFTASSERIQSAIMWSLKDGKLTWSSWRGFTIAAAKSTGTEVMGLQLGRSRRKVLRPVLA
jgi:hypothetical protein